jgi:hypothetical protein
MLKTRNLGSARGIPRAIYSGEICPDYVCSLCMEVLNDPYQCKNGHMNCKECWNDLVLKTGPECTLCRTEVYGLNDLSKCLLVRRQIAALPVTCICLQNINASNAGCQWTGTLAEREERECEFLFSECVHDGCNQRVKTESLKFHINHCPKRLKKCENCDKFFSFEDLKGRHHEVCDAQTRMVGCHCGVWIKAVDLANHKSIECPMTLIPCAIFRDIGMCVESCNGTIKRGASTIHLGSNAALIKAMHLKNQSLQNNHHVRNAFFNSAF